MMQIHFLFLHLKPKMYELGKNPAIGENEFNVEKKVILDYMKNCVFIMLAFTESYLKISFS